MEPVYTWCQHVILGELINRSFVVTAHFPALYRLNSKRHFCHTNAKFRRQLFSSCACTVKSDKVASRKLAQLSSDSSIRLYSNNKSPVCLFLWLLLLLIWYKWESTSTHAEDDGTFYRLNNLCMMKIIICCTCQSFQTSETINIHHTFPNVWI